MSAEDYLPADLFERDLCIKDYKQYGTVTSNSHFKTCKFCGKKGLVWSYGSGRWRLCDGDKNIHSCEEGK
jgi:hypothetical protein